MRQVVRRRPPPLVYDNCSARMLPLGIRVVPSTFQCAQAGGPSPVSHVRFCRVLQYLIQMPILILVLLHLTLDEFAIVGRIRPRAEPLILQTRQPILNTQQVSAARCPHPPRAILLHRLYVALARDLVRCPVLYDVFLGVLLQLLGCALLINGPIGGLGSGVVWVAAILRHPLGMREHLRVVP